MMLYSSIAIFALYGTALAHNLMDVISDELVRQRIPFQEPCDDTSTQIKFDFIIVGAGAAGSALANRLTEHKDWSVLLLEAGAEETPNHDIPYYSGFNEVQDDWGFTMGPQESGCVGAPNSSCPYIRAHVMGGCTSINGMNAVRGNRQDYDHWQELGNDGWSYDDVLPYFKKLERVEVAELQNSSYRGTEGYVPFSYSPYKVPGTDEYLQAAEELGIPLVDPNGETQEGVSRIQFTQSGCRRVSGNGAYLFPIRARRNLFVRKRSLVHKILIENKVAVGVEYERDGHKQRAYAKKEVILSAGAVMSPVLLMLSGIGPKEQLESFGIEVIHDLPVGEHLKDHPAFYGLQIIFNPDTYPNRYEVINSPEFYVDYYRNGTGPLSWILIESIRFFHVGNDSEASWPNIEAYYIYGEETTIPSIANSLGIPQSFYDEYYAPLLDQLSAVFTVLHMRPRSTGYVRLSGNDIKRHPPIIQPKMLTDELDVREMAEGVMEAMKIFDTETMRQFGARVYNATIPGCEGLDMTTIEYWECGVRVASHNMYHPCCTAKMGPDGDSSSVVDPELKVRGIHKLRVIDTSVFPDMPTAHTMIPTYMVAEKGADIIKKAHGVVR